MPPKKKKNAPKKATPKKKAAKKTPAKKTAPKKKAIKKASRPAGRAGKKAAPALLSADPAIAGGRPCICIENNEGWFCMKRLPNGQLKECDGPFDSKEECEEHECR